MAWNITDCAIVNCKTNCKVCSCVFHLYVIIVYALFLLEAFLTDYVSYSLRYLIHLLTPASDLHSLHTSVTSHISVSRDVDTVCTVCTLHTRVVTNTGKKYCNNNSNTWWKKYCNSIVILFAILDLDACKTTQHSMLTVTYVAYAYVGLCRLLVLVRC